MFRVPAVIAAGAAALLVAAPTRAQDEGFADGDDAAGFGDEAPVDPDAQGFGEEPAANVTQETMPLPVALTGFLRTGFALWAERFEDNPFAKLRQGLDLTLTYRQEVLRVVLAGHAEYDFAYLTDRASYDAPTLAAYEWQVDTREALLGLSLGEIELTVGRQIVAWGEGDLLSPLDVVNPRDLREPGQSDLDDMRLPVLATRLGWFHGGHRLEAMLVHESRFGYRSPPLGPFSPFDALLTSDPAAKAALAGKTLEFEDEEAQFSAQGQQVLLRWVYKGAPVDLGLYFASVLDQQGVVRPIVVTPELFTAERLPLVLHHARKWVVGTSGAAALPYGFLLKWEVGAEIGRLLNIGEPPYALDIAPADLIHTMLGCTFTWVRDLTLALEIHKPWLLTDLDDLLFEVDAPIWAARASYQLFDQRLTMNAVAMLMGWQVELGWLFRTDVSYQFFDGFEVGLGYVTYQPGSEVGPFHGLDRHDRLFLNVRWDFQVF